MAKLAKIENGVVVDMILGDQMGGYVAAPDEAGIGWTFSGGAFSAPVVQLPTPEPVNRVSARQFKLQLLEDGLLDDVSAFVASQSQAVQIAYENSATFYRDDPMMLAGFAALEKNEADITAFFIAASQL